MANDKTYFPSNIPEALAMLYLQNQGLSGKTPEDVVGLYYDAYYKIHKHHGEARSKSKQKYSQGISY